MGKRLLKVCGSPGVGVFWGPGHSCCLTASVGGAVSLDTSATVSCVRLLLFVRTCASRAATTHSHPTWRSRTCCPPPLPLCVCLTAVPQSWLKAPLVDPSSIRQRLDIVDALVTDQGLRDGLRDALRGERGCFGVGGTGGLGRHTCMQPGGDTLSVCARIYVLSDGDQGHWPHIRTCSSRLPACLPACLVPPRAATPTIRLSPPRPPPHPPTHTHTQACLTLSA
jgi:hypothetical protein